MNLETAQSFLENYTGKSVTEIFEIAQSGSARANYSGVSGNQKYIVTYNQNLQENEAFFYFSDVFQGLNLNTPKILAISDDRKLYIQQFLGATTLSELIATEGSSSKVKKLIQQTLDKLFILQNSTEGKIDYSKTFEYQEYDQMPVMHDLNYFKFLFVDVIGVPYHKSTLLREFVKIALKIEELQPKGLMIRDFQSRNILVNEQNEISFIDYQAAMLGPLMYDVISLLFQAKANFSKEFQEEMLDYFITKFPADEQHQLRFSIPPLQLTRFVQVLGAYGLRGLIQRKKHFVTSIQQGIENLYNFAQNWNQISDYPELHRLIRELKTPETTLKINQILDGHPQLPS